MQLSSARGRCVIDAVEPIGRYLQILAIDNTAVRQAQVERLRSILSKRYGADVDLAISIDPEVVGGFRLRAGMSAIDASLASRISAARDAIAS